MEAISGAMNSEYAQQMNEYKKRIIYDDTKFKSISIIV